MEAAEEELERRSKFLNSLILKKKSVEQKEQHELLNVRVRASDMPATLQNHAFKCARDNLDSMPKGKLDSKRIALGLKKEFDSKYGPAWHCIVGTSFGSYVTHSLGGFLYFSIDKLHVPGCTTLTPGGVIKAVELLTTNKHRLKSLSINGIYNIKREELEILHQLVGEKRIKQSMQGPNLYHHFKKLATIGDKETSCVIDVDICPKCSEIRVIMDCPRASCKRMAEKQQQADCSGCSHCIPRCEECGVCIKDDEPGDAACADTLCLDCWLQLPKCNFCNKPYCNQHAGQQCFLLGSSGFLCTTCNAEFMQKL